MVLDVAFYRSVAGNEPVRAWLKRLSKDARQTIGADIHTVEKLWPVGKPVVDGLGEGLWEVRSTHDKVEYRVLFGIVGGTMYLLHGFVKQTRATTRADKDLGYERLAEVKAREKKRKKL